MLTHSDNEGEDLDQTLAAEEEDARDLDNAHNTSNDEEDTDETEGNDRVGDTYNKVYGDMLPAPKGTMAKRFAKAGPSQLRALTKAFYDFLNEATPNLNILNTDNNLYAALVALPQSAQMRLVYGFGLGTSPIGKSSTLDGCILVLTKEADATLGPPLPMILPADAMIFIDRPCPSGQRVQQKITEDDGYLTYPLVKATSTLNKITEKEKCMKLAPVPAHLFFDAFDKDISAGEAYERLLHCADSQEEYMQHALAVTRASLLTASKKGTHLPISCLINSGDSRDLRQWATMKCKTFIPPEDTQQPPPLIPVPPMPPQPPVTAPIRPAALDETSSITMHVPQKDKISRREQIRLFTMLGYEAKDITNLKEEDLPAHIREVEEETTKHMKEIVIKERIASHTKYSDCPVPIHPTILETIRKRDFGASDGFARPSYAQACTKLSPFLCIDFTETQMAHIQEVTDAFQHASVTTPADYIAMKSSKAIVPEDFGDFIAMLCTFANLIYAWFTGGSSLFGQIEALINAIKAFQRTSRAYFTLEVKATILWLTFLQARLFAEGKGEIFTPFTRMVDNLTAKDTRIQYAELPADLITNSRLAYGKGTPSTEYGSGKRKVNETGWKQTDQQNDEYNNGTERQNRKPNPNCWHPKLKAVLEEPLTTLKKKGQQQRDITIKRIAEYCGASLNQLNPNRRTCGSNRVLGYCFGGTRCHRTHALPSDEEATKIIALIKKFTESPEGILDVTK